MQLISFKQTDADKLPFHITWKQDNESVIRINSGDVPEQVYDAYQELLAAFVAMLKEGEFLYGDGSIQYLEFAVKETEAGTRMDIGFRSKKGIYYPYIKLKDLVVQYSTQEDLKQVAEVSHGQYKAAIAANAVFAALENLEIVIEEHWEELTSTRQLRLSL